MDILSVARWKPRLLVELLGLLKYIIRIIKVKLVLLDGVQNIVYLVDYNRVQIVQDGHRFDLGLLQVR